ncbi:MAG: hypothetical protein E5X05_01340 [Mesorhizobium sp.]|nr:MAG: hypothetical protein E5X05_01340 [Mesorhizobium sp.]
MVGTPTQIDGISDGSEIRLVLYQSGRFVHTPLQQILDAILGAIDAAAGGEGLLLEGDEFGLGFSFLTLEGDESGTLLLEGA